VLVGLRSALDAGADGRGKARLEAQRDALRPFLPQTLGLYLAVAKGTRGGAAAKADVMVTLDSADKDFGRLVKVLGRALEAGPKCAGLRCEGDDARSLYVLRFRPRADGSLALGVVLQARAGARGALAAHEAAAEEVFGRAVGAARMAFLAVAKPKEFGRGRDGKGEGAGGAAAGVPSEVEVLQAAARVLALRPDEPVVLATLVRRAARAKRYGRALDLLRTLVTSPAPDAVAAADLLVLGGGDPALAALKTAPGFAKTVAELLATPPTDPEAFAAYLVRFRASDRRLRRALGGRSGGAGLSVQRCRAPAVRGAKPSCDVGRKEGRAALAALRAALEGLDGEPLHALPVSGSGVAGGTVATWVGPLLVPTGQQQVIPVPAIQIGPRGGQPKALAVLAVRLPKP